MNIQTFFLILIVAHLIAVSFVNLIDLLFKLLHRQLRLCKMKKEIDVDCEKLIREYRKKTAFIEETFIKDIGFSNRSKNALTKNNIKTLR